MLTSQPQDWSNRVSLGNAEGYREKFEKIQDYFSPRFAEATKVGNEMIKTIEENLRARKQEQQEQQEQQDRKQ
jgi:prephenate dehydrogenase (NADP+)